MNVLQTTYKHCINFFLTKQTLYKFPVMFYKFLTHFLALSPCCFGQKSFGQMPFALTIIIWICVPYHKINPVFKLRFQLLRHPLPKQSSQNERKSAGSFCCQVAALVPDLFCNFYLVKNHKIAKNSTTSDAREKIITDPQNFRNFLMYV